MTEKKTYTSPGQPTKYEPKHCDMLIEHMAMGKSFESFSAVINVCTDTLYSWSNEKHASFVLEFSEAKKLAFAKNLDFWEGAGIEGLWDQTLYDEQTGKPSIRKSLNSTVWIFNMKNRHRWKDRQEIELEANVKTNPLKEEMKKKTTEELLALLDKAKVEE